MNARTLQILLALLVMALTPSAHSVLWAQDQVRQGLALLDQGRTDEAINAFLQAVKADSSNWRAWYNLGVAYHAKGEPLEKAISAYRKCIETKGEFAPAHYNLGMVYQERGKYDQSIQAYRQAISLSPDLLTVAENPIIVNNPHAVVLQVYRYLEQAGAQILPPTR